MSKNPYSKIVAQPTPQTQPLPGREKVMAANNAGGYSFVLDDWKSLERFLILGAEGGTYYAKERDLVLQNVAVLDRCMAADPKRTAQIVAEVSESGRAFKNSAAIFALAYMVKQGGPARFAAFDVMARVARTGRSLLELHQNLETFKVKSTMGRRKAFGRWITSRRPSEIAYQMIKYPTSGTLAMRDLLNYIHVRPGDEAMSQVLAYIHGSYKGEIGALPEIVQGWEAIKAATSGKEAAKIVSDYRLTWEFVPGQWQGDKEVWQALLPNLPYTALIRNLGRMSSYGLLETTSDNAKFVRDRLTDANNLRKARVHPMTILVAWRTYGGGGNDGKTKLTWQPSHKVRDALEEAFYLSFDNVEPSGKNIMLALDVSGSMSAMAGGLPIMCCEATALMAMVAMRVEKDAFPMAFDAGIRDLKLSKHDSLDAVLRKVHNVNFGGTDCALPMMHALQNGMNVDEFVVMTDSETYAGHIHPAAALKKYREKTGIDAKLVVVGMTSNGFSIADPADAGMLDIVGMSPDVPLLISRFAAGL